MFIPVRGYSAPGRYPKTEDQVRHLHRHRTQNGLGPAFVKVQGRVLFDPERIEQLLIERAQQSSAVA